VLLWESIGLAGCGGSVLLVHKQLKKLDTSFDQGVASNSKCTQQKTEENDDSPTPAVEKGNQNAASCLLMRLVCD